MTRFRQLYEHEYEKSFCHCANKTKLFYTFFPFRPDVQRSVQLYRQTLVHVGFFCFHSSRRVNVPI